MDTSFDVRRLINNLFTCSYSRFINEVLTYIQSVRLAVQWEPEERGRAQKLLEDSPQPFNKSSAVTNPVPKHDGV